MIKKIKNWFVNLNKQKCSNCKSADIKKIEEKFIESKIITKSFQTIDRTSIRNGGVSNNPRGGLSTTEFYEI